MKSFWVIYKSSLDTVQNWIHLTLIFSKICSECYIRVYAVWQKIRCYIRLKLCLYIKLYYDKSCHRQDFPWLIFFQTFYLGSHGGSVQVGSKLLFHVTSNCLSHVSICLKFKTRASTKKNIRGKQSQILKPQCTMCYLSEHNHKVFYENFKQGQYQWGIIFVCLFWGTFGLNYSICQNDS